MVKDGFDGEVFNMRVSLKWTMDDFLAYGNGNKQGPKIGGGANNMTKGFTMHQLQFEEESDDELENKADLFELDYLKDFAFRINKEPQICIAEKFQMMMCGGSGSRIQIAAKGIIQDVDEEYFTILGHIMKEHVIWRKEKLQTDLFPADCLVVLRVEDVDAVLEMKLLVFFRNTLIGEMKWGILSLTKATITRVQTVGMGDRVCVDLCSLMKPGEGLLVCPEITLVLRVTYLKPHLHNFSNRKGFVQVGSFARGLYLVHSECLESNYIASRPFSVNVLSIVIGLTETDFSTYVGLLNMCIVCPEST
ncbi:3-dehydroquinate synthase [Thalictrum thalictroides]|uniref:3-dehydroquinate synthase n=1 Tax=Thalictrum thalictroides TaxID=46969 RepID=A0A7J6UXD5_THATH|nr:3-dehydroquinate synthase [Thalictrum thalictroides]